MSKNVPGWADAHHSPRQGSALAPNAKILGVFDKKTTVGVKKRAFYPLKRLVV